MPDSLPRSTPKDSSANNPFASEVYTLLAGIIGSAEVLHAKFGNDPNLDQIGRSARRLLALAEPMIRASSGQMTTPSGTPTATAPVAGQRRGILYVEDHEGMFLIVKRLLEKRPAIKLFHAPNGETGLRMARMYRPEAILLDLDLPDMHGHDVLEQLAGHPDTKDTPVIVVSGDNNSMQIERMLAAGARDYLTKPMKADRLLLAIDALFAEIDSRAT